MAAVLPVFLNVFAQQQAVLEGPAQSSQAASLPVPNPTKSFWLDTPDANPLAKEGSDGPLTADADIVILGSGITGVSAAYHLSRLLSATDQPLKVVILEARDFCSGATGRNGGHLTANVFQDFAAYSALFGVDDAKRAIALEKHTVSEIVNILNLSGHQHAVDLIAGGRTNLLFTEPEVAEARIDYEAAKKAGIDVSGVEFLTKEQVKKEYGASYPAVRTPGYNIWPLKLVTHLYRLAKETSDNSTTFSLALHTNTPATAITPISGSESSSRRWNVTTPRGPVAASYVLHATNAYASHLLPHLHGPSGIVPTRGQIIATRAGVTLDALTTSGFTGNEGFEYWFPRPLEANQTNPLVILGGGREQSKPEFELYVTDDSQVNPKVGKALREFLPTVFPGLYEAGKAPEMEWSGIMGYTKTGDPFVGPVIDSASSGAYYNGQYVSAGYTGHGMPRAFSCAEAVVQMMLADISGKEWTVPDWLPRHHLTQNRLHESE
ncbi:FAD dependent oxidoreductase [Lenzites betulinus]|nr:FAD dependent oxidoreductase [Lenzites betulinus]